jgi:hypothetical protein
VIVIDPEPVMARPANSELPLNTTTPDRRDEMLWASKERLRSQQKTVDEGANPSSPRKAVVTWTHIPEIWAALERRFL